MRSFHLVCGSLVPCVESSCASSWSSPLAPPPDLALNPQAIGHHALCVNERPPQLRIVAELLERALQGLAKL
jgi:hypothetical protein